MTWNGIHGHDGVAERFRQALVRGRLPAAPSTAQQAFLERAVAGLSQEDKVVPVRLSLFADMVKVRPWTSSTLRELGGAEGVGRAIALGDWTAIKAAPGVAFVEEA